MRGPQTEDTLFERGCGDEEEMKEIGIKVCVFELLKGRGGQVLTWRRGAAESFFVFSFSLSAAPRLRVPLLLLEPFLLHLPHLLLIPTSP